MLIDSIKIENYKSFHKSEEIKLNNGYNIIVGMNNVGKSSLLEALKLSVESCPHLSIETKPSITTKNNHRTKIIVNIKIYKDELLSFFQEHNENKISLPGGANNGYNLNEITLFENFLNDKSFYNFQFILEDNKIVNSGILDLSIDFNYTKSLIYNISFNPFKITNLSNILQGNNESFFYSRMFMEFRNYIYYFCSERYMIGKSKIGYSQTLNSNASNLPEVIDNLKSNPERFNRFNETIREIFPEIKRITTINRANNTVEIMLWTIDPTTERQDLAIPLNKSGTGVGQIIALLYVVINSEKNRTIIIDEPQTFLHPGAIRKLLQVLDRYQKHQYIFATHSPTVVNSANNSSILLLEKKDFETSMRKIDKKDMVQIKSMLEIIGVSVSDVFGADYIVWVEGPTEEKAFPLLLKTFLSSLEFSSIQICAVQHTGDFDGKKAKLVFDIYDKLSGGNRVIPPAISFIFDNENKKEKDKEDIKRRAKKPVYFLKRVMFENYLINQNAILAVIKKRINDYEIEDIEVDVDRIRIWIESNYNNEKYYKKQWLEDNGLEINKLVFDEPEWVSFLHAASFLKDLFNEIFHSKYIYDKIIDSVELSKWISVNEPDFFSELVEELKESIKFEYS